MKFAEPDLLAIALVIGIIILFALVALLPPGLILLACLALGVDKPFIVWLIVQLFWAVAIILYLNNVEWK